MLSVKKLPKRILREKLEKAIIEGTPGDIRKAITEFQADNVEDKGEVERAEQRLKFFVLKKGIKVVKGYTVFHLTQQTHYM